MNFPDSLHHLLNNRKKDNLFRSLKTHYPSIDFSSNDYLGFSSQGLLSHEIEKLQPSRHIGSTGSRLISGNSFLFNELEQTIAAFHHAEAALIYNSGYDANVGLLSCIAQKGDLIISDELIHASLIDGIRLSYATNYKCKHNDLNDLVDLLERHRTSFKETFLVVESVYSMDGDSAPLKEIAAICKKYQVHLIVDEAHGIGVFGKQGNGLCQALEIERHCFARIYTFGKAMGCHGAAVVGSLALKDYLINFSRSFIYTTAMPEHSVLAIKAAYTLLESNTNVNVLADNIAYFNSKLIANTSFIQSNSAIHCKIIAGNKQVQEIEHTCAEHQLFVKAIKSPTVKLGQERIRICLHAFNTKQEIDVLLETIA